MIPCLFLLKVKNWPAFMGSGRPMTSSSLIVAWSPSLRALASSRSNCVLTMAAQLETWPVPNIGGEEIGTHLQHARGDDRSPGVAEYDDLLFAELMAEVNGEFDTVFGDAVEGDVGGFLSVAAIGVARAALVPMHYDEFLFPWPIDFGSRPLRLTRAAVDDQQHRV
jgi:hypothetical protein